MRKKFISLLTIMIMLMCECAMPLTAHADSISFGSSGSSSYQYYNASKGSSEGSTSTKLKDGGMAYADNSGNSMTISKSSKYYAGKTYTVKASRTSSNGIKITSSDSSIASVSTTYAKDGKSATAKVSCKKAGTVKIKMVDKKTGKTIFSHKMTINPYVKNIKFSSSTKALKKGKSVTLNYQITKYNGKSIAAKKVPSGVKFKASSSNTKVVKVTSSSTGKVKIKGVKKGTATVTVKAKDGSGKTAKIKVTVK